MRFYALQLWAENRTRELAPYHLVNVPRRSGNDRHYEEMPYRWSRRWHGDPQWAPPPSRNLGEPRSA
jgi:hypothetical protein